MKINKDLVLKLADLLNLDLSEKEIIKFSKQLSEIVSFVEILNSVKGEIEVKKNYLDLEEISRRDEVNSYCQAELEIALSQSRRQAGLVKAPKIR